MRMCCDDDAEFDSATSAPFEIHTMPLVNAERPKAKKRK